VNSATEVHVADASARQLARWVDAGLIDEDTASRIRAFEAARGDSSRWRWFTWLALVFGGVTIGAGTLLFVSAHWDTLSPQVRFALVTALVAVFHVCGALVAERFPAMAATLHAIGTAALGAGIFLAAQIFNLDEHWPSGLLLWTLGAALALALLKTWPHTVLVAALAPAWLLAEWSVAIGPIWSPAGSRIVACGMFLLALAYFTNVRSEPIGAHRRSVTWLGGIALIPWSFALAVASEPILNGFQRIQPLPTQLRVVGWTIALGLPALVALVTRRARAWPQALATLWAVALVGLHPKAADISLYAWWALGAIVLAAWGVSEHRSERVNMGAAAFGATVVAFYFSHVMDKLGRSASLVGLGLLFLAGGWVLEQARRRLVVKARGGVS
jgi:uncharacterized membrane protein